MMEREPKSPRKEEVGVVSTAWPMDERLLAAAIAADLPSARTLLESALATAPEKARSTVLRLLLTGAIANKATEESARWMDTIQKEQPDEPSTFAGRLWERAMAGDLDGRAAAAEAWLARFPEESLPQRDLALVAAQRGDYAGSVKRWREVFRQGKGAVSDYNEAAWTGLFVEENTPEILEWAKRAGEGKNTTSAQRHTLAVVLASKEDASKALGLFRGLATATPDDAVWVIPARLAHRLGLNDEARALYRRAAGSAPKPRLNSTAALATKWLSELDGGAARPAAK
ncbi:MAG: hypothetical protein AMXMBFR34_09350 [Myxococcaceae bacterium]